MGLRRRRGPDRGTVAVRRAGDQSLAHGVVVDTRIVARLFRLPVLRLDGVVLLSPTAATDVDVPPVVVPSTATEVVDPVRPTDGDAIGDELTEVARTLARLRNGHAAR